MQKRLMVPLLLLAAVGCSPVLGPIAPMARLAALSPYRAAAGSNDQASLQKAVLAQLETCVATRQPGTTLAVEAGTGWLEFHGTDVANQVKFNVITTLKTGATLPSNQAEFYGLFDRSTGKLVPQTLWVGAEAEATYFWLRPTP
ncbi:MAG: hypothetical protein H7338_01190 [Candidatus Sericytochromatia bacterium]|nr:hypothetical protein [Candidatus Sericytochromatia bacterium]